MQRNSLRTALVLFVSRPGLSWITLGTEIPSLSPNVKTNAHIKKAVGYRDGFIVSIWKLHRRSEYE
jgi:hypothetical protein